MSAGDLPSWAVVPVETVDNDNNNNENENENNNNNHHDKKYSWTEILSLFFVLLFIAGGISGIIVGIYLSVATDTCESGGCA